MKNFSVLSYAILVVLFLYTFVFTKAQQPQPIINASLIGTVIDATTKEPIEGVTIQLEAVTHSVKTDQKGKFQFVTGQKLPFTLGIWENMQIDPKKSRPNKRAANPKDLLLCYNN